MTTKRRMAAMVAALAAATMLGTAQAQAQTQPEPVTTAAGYECGLNTWYTSEPYFGTLIH